MEELSADDAGFPGYVAGSRLGNLLASEGCRSGRSIPSACLCLPSETRRLTSRSLFAQAKDSHAASLLACSSHSSRYSSGAVASEVCVRIRAERVVATAGSLERIDSTVEQLFSDGTRGTRLYRFPFERLALCQKVSGAREWRVESAACRRSSGVSVKTARETWTGSIVCVHHLPSRLPHHEVYPNLLYARYITHSS